MNITQVVLNLDCGGLEHLTIQLSEKLKQKGHVPDIVCLAQPGVLAKEAEARGIRVTSLGKGEGFDKSIIFKLARHLRENKIDLVHTHNMAPLLYGTLAAKFAFKKCMNTRHGREAKKAPALIWAMNRYVAAVSEDAKREMLQHNWINKDKLKVVYNGIDLERFSDHIDHQKVQTFRQSIGVDAETFMIGCVGRLAKEKDHETLIKAFHKLMRKKMNSVLVIVGDGPLRKHLEYMVRNLEIENSVKFLGYRNDVSEIMKAFNVYVMASFMEGVSLTLLEAMATGKPVVTTKVGGNPEVVLENHTGYLVPCGFPERIENAVMRLYVNRKVAVQMGEEGRRRVKEKFNLEKMAEEYISLYQN